MNSNLTLPSISADDFVRRYSVRGPKMMWLLGAGASASAGVPTAGNMIWEFKQLLYVTQHRISSKSVSDLSNAAVCEKLQAHIDSSGGFPSNGSPDEYAALFEAAYPSESDRRTYIESKIKGAKPSYGHLALATLMRADLVRVVWTTNFDSLVADACAKIYDSTAALATVALDAPDLASQLLRDERWPIEIKIHGDFRSRRLKNTTDELRQQDARLRQVFEESCARFGLAIMGYSGRDASIMEVLEAALEGENPFPSGLFWLHRESDEPLTRVANLIERAAAKGIEAAVVSIDSFDEVLRDIMRVVDKIPRKELDAFEKDRRRWSSAPRPTGKSSWPVIRLNALPIIQLPTVCRRVECDIGGMAEVREAIAAAQADIIGVRIKSAVLSFGSDLDVRRAFEPFSIKSFDLHSFDKRQLWRDTSQRGLIQHALIRAVAAHSSLQIIRRRGTSLLVPDNPAESTWGSLRRIVKTTHGALSAQPELSWREGISLCVEWANDSLWLLFEPRTVFLDLPEEHKSLASDFARERSVGRYNRQLNNLIEFWSQIISNGGSELRAFNIDEGVDARFKISSATAHSWRAK